ncbi:MAG TPA: alpha/beta hydrolase [Actinomycetota bacterium]|nr:alpha/beta hydrolase [Actinomycetota bacterium]
MADGKKRARRAGLITGAIALGVGAAAAAGAAGTRAFLRRERGRPDPYKDEDYGMRRGRSIGPVASFDGTLLNVEEIGTGPTVVLSHGFSLNSTTWHHQMRDLSSEIRMVMYDHRGHGYSGLPPSDDWSLDALAHDLEAVIRDAANREPVIVVGHSMGGMTLLRYCELFPEAIGARIRGIVLVDTTSADVMGGLLPAIARRLHAAVEGVEEVALRALQGRTDNVDQLRTRANNLVYLGTRLMGFGRDPSPTQVEFIEKLLSEVPSSVWFKLIPTMLGMDVSGALDSIGVPALVIAGEKDKLTPLAAAERIADGIPRAELVVLPDTGHIPMLERADEFNALLRRFVLRVTTADASR